MRRLTRTRNQLDILNDYEIFRYQDIREDGELVEKAMTVESKPIDHVQAIQDENWKGAMIEDLKAIENNQTQEFIKYLGKKGKYVRWVYKLKLKQNGEIVKCKAMLVEKGFLQNTGSNFNEVYAPFSILETMR